MDYHQESKSNTNEYHGEYDGSILYPNANPWEARQMHFADARVYNLGAEYQPIPHSENNFQQYT